MDPNIEGANQAQDYTVPRTLQILNQGEPHHFVKPIKRIHEGHDVPRFLTSRAYQDIGTFVMQLNIAMCPRKSSQASQSQVWQLDSPIVLSEPVQKLQELLQHIDSIIEEAPPDTGPRRFGNVSFRKWNQLLEERVKGLLKNHLPKSVVELQTDTEDGISVLDELIPYLMGGFGSAQRLDYGTGHELSFLAFLGCIWKLGGFTKEHSNDGALERTIVIGIIEPYLRVVRRLILTYTLEPAGSHGVWGLDDHFFLSYIFGSAQYCPPITDTDAMPVEDSLPSAPNPADISKKAIVQRERQRNMYFSAVGFINDVKTGPFWEHSPILFDISGIRSGWGKINKGMIKMYNAEVLSKFPVVQHFPFGSLFSWDLDPDAVQMIPSIHTASQPAGGLASSNVTAARPTESTRAPWASASSASGPMSSTAAPWASLQSRQPPGIRGQDISLANNSPNAPTKAPWTSQGRQERK